MSVFGGYLEIICLRLLPVFAGRQPSVQDILYLNLLALAHKPARRFVSLVGGIALDLDFYGAHNHDRLWSTEPIEPALIVYPHGIAEIGRATDENLC